MRARITDWSARTETIAPVPRHQKGDGAGCLVFSLLLVGSFLFVGLLFLIGWGVP